MVTPSRLEGGRETTIDLFDQLAVTLNETTIH